MRKPVTFKDIEDLWERHARTCVGGQDVVAADALGEIIAELNLDTGADAIQHMLHDAGTPSGLAREQFFALMASMCGNGRTRLQIAYEIFDADGDGRVTADEVYDVLAHFEIDRDDVTALVRETDQEGAGSITFEDFCALMPDTHAQTRQRYCDDHAMPVMPAPPSEETQTQQKDIKAAPNKHARRSPGQGTSRLQMQIGLFRLLQGAAYRSFRENCAANCETHLRAKRLPYTITHFVAFTDAAFALYKALDIVEPSCHGVLDAVNDSVRNEFARLQDRIENWQTIHKTRQMEEAEETIEATRRARNEAREVLAAGVELALTLRRKNLDVTDIAQGRLSAHELMRQRNLDLHVEHSAESDSKKNEPSAYLQSWNRVILRDVDEDIDGAIMPAAYWYEDFMPKLLAACSVSSAHDVPHNVEPDEAALDRWFETAHTAGEFEPFADAVAMHFKDCTPVQKLEIRQAWRLTRHYLNGVQKRRERSEFGRENGFLCEYVAFLDVYLGRSDVRNAEMRVSFPYFIGPPTWRFLHTAAEIICDCPPSEQTELVALFKDFFRLFANMYPCPYCRYHLNRFVVRNREVEMYPLEYLILGSHPEEGAFEVSIEDKLDTITDGASLRLFLWKLHNAVSSSIARTEAWYRPEEDAPYTTRHWPSLEAERIRATALGAEDLLKTETGALKSLRTHVENLAALRRKLATNDPSDGVGSHVEFLEKARTATSLLEHALADTHFLETNYHFDPSLEDDAPHFTPEEEIFSRSGHFVEA